LSFRATTEGVELPGAYSFELVALCGRWNVEPAAVLEGTGLTLDDLKKPETRLPIDVCATLVERARRLTGEPALAFWMGLHMRPSWHGFLGFAAMTASTPREAIEIAERFCLTRTSAFGIACYVEGDVASLVLEERVPLGALREFVVITLLVGIAQIARDVTGQPIRGIAECAFPAPAYAMALLSRPGADAAGTMVFGKPAHRLVFDASVLDLPLRGADPAAMQLARAQCDRELAAIAETSGFVGHVRSVVATGVEGTPSLEEVAHRMHVSPRTLKRRLATHGASFSAVVEEVRHQRALLLLDDQRLALAEVADRLGYSDVANFTRAFRRWTGQTPAAFRRR
jgi:AraC-like DNA-binding protein